MAEKKAFAWDKEVLVKTIEVSDYEKREVRICELNGKEYVVFTTVKKIKDEWKPVGGYSLPKAVFPDICGAINTHDIINSFHTDDSIVIPAKKTRAKKGDK